MLTRKSAASSITPDDAATPVALGRELFHVAGRRDRSGFTFWIERPRGKIWRHINEPLGEMEPRSINSGAEIVALTSQEPLLRQIAIASGWFSPTGRTLRFPFSDDNEIWALTAECLRTFATPAPVNRAETDQPPSNYSAALSAFLGGWIRRTVNHLEIAAALVLGPSPLARSANERILLGAFPDTLERLSQVFTRPTASSGLVQVVQLDASKPGWEGAAAAQGYRLALQVSVPAVASRTFDCILLWTRSNVSSNAAAAVAALNAWPDMQRMLISDSPLSRREIECLQYTASGYTAQECAQLLGFSEANVRHHLKRAMRRLGAPNTVSAIQRAQLMGLLG